jgi:hypothetical protein
MQGAHSDVEAEGDDSMQAVLWPEGQLFYASTSIFN